MTTQFFRNERDIQTWLSTQLKNNLSIGDLILNIEEIHDYKPKTPMEEKIHLSYIKCLESLYTNELFSEDENIAINPEDSLRPDFLLYAADTESFVIVELKNNAASSRQTGTEISAYAAGLRSYAPFLSEGDIVNVIISPVWPTLLKHFILQEIFWIGRNVICLKPSIHEGKPSLEIVNISGFSKANFDIMGQTEEFLGGYNICLQDYDIYKDKTKRDRLDNHMNQMIASLMAMTATGNSQKNHGFAFLWHDQSTISITPYLITVLNVAPFKSEGIVGELNTKQNKIQKRLKKLIHDFDPSGHTGSLDLITESGIQFLKPICSPTVEGYTSWAPLRSIMLKRGILIAFVGWGVFGELFNTKLLQFYEEIGSYSTHTNPLIALEMIDEIFPVTNYENLMDIFDDEDDLPF